MRSRASAWAAENWANTFLRHRPASLVGRCSVRAEPTITTGIVQMLCAALRIVRNPQSFVVGMACTRAEQHHPHWQDDQSHRQPRLFENVVAELWGERITGALRKAGRIGRPFRRHRALLALPARGPAVADGSGKALGGGEDISRRNSAPRATGRRACGSRSSPRTLRRLWRENRCASAIWRSSTNRGAERRAASARHGCG